MSEHELIQDRLFAYVDGELEPQDVQAVEQHVAVCAACASELATTRQASFVFAAAPAYDMPSGFYDRMWAKIDAAEGVEVAEDEDALADLGRVLESGLAEESRAADVGGRRVEAPRAGLSLLALETVAQHTNGKVAPRVASRPSRGSRATLSRLAVAAVLLLSFALGLRLLWPRPAPPATSEAVLAYGADVTLKAADTSAERTVQHAVGLQAGNFIATSKDSAIVTIGRSGSLRLAPMSRVLVQAVSSREGKVFVKIRLDQGAAWVKEGEDVQCVVQTSTALLVPIGTSYDARVDGGDTQVSVFQGQVRVSPTGMDETGEALEAGQQARISDGGRRVTTGLVNPSDVQSDPWYQWNQSVEAPPASQHQPMEAPRVVNTPPAPMPWFQNPPPSPRWTVSPQDSRRNRGAGGTPGSSTEPWNRRSSTPDDPWVRTGGTPPSGGTRTTEPWSRPNAGTPGPNEPWRRTPPASRPDQPSGRPAATPRTTTWNPTGAPGQTTRWPQAPQRTPGQATRRPQAPQQTTRWPQAPQQTPGQTTRGPQAPQQTPGQTTRWPQAPQQTPGQTTRWPQQTPGQTTETPRWRQQGPGQRWPQQNPGQTQGTPQWRQQGPGQRWPQQSPGQTQERPRWRQQRTWPGTGASPGSQQGTWRPANQQGTWRPGQGQWPRRTPPPRQTSPR